jgi:hypothetical protein
MSANQGGNRFIIVLYKAKFVGLVSCLVIRYQPLSTNRTIRDKASTLSPVTDTGSALTRLSQLVLQQLRKILSSYY